MFQLSLNFSDFHCKKFKLNELKVIEDKENRFYFHEFNPSTAAALHWVASHCNHPVTSLTHTVPSAVSLLRSCDCCSCGRPARLSAEVFPYASVCLSSRGERQRRPRLSEAVDDVTVEVLMRANRKPVTAAGQARVAVETFQY